MEGEEEEDLAYAAEYEGSSYSYPARRPKYGTFRTTCTRFVTLYATLARAEPLI